MSPAAVPNESYIIYVKQFRRNVGLHVVVDEKCGMFLDSILAIGKFCSSKLALCQKIRSILLVRITSAIYITLSVH